MGFESEIGSIEVGKSADLICVDFDRLEALPCFEAISQIVYASGRQQVSDVWIAGRRKLEDGQLVDVDVLTLISKAREWQSRIEAVQRRAAHG
jgi:5-methylthioadenosine/S-adenosylhomocysteine deaminase